MRLSRNAFPIAVVLAVSLVAARSSHAQGSSAEPSTGLLPGGVTSAVQVSGNTQDLAVASAPGTTWVWLVRAQLLRLSAPVRVEARRQRIAAVRPAAVERRRIW